MAAQQGAGGWVKWHRQWLQEPWFMSAELTQIAVYCLSEAAYRPTVKSVKVASYIKSVSLQAGQLITSRDEIARATKQHTNSITKRLKVLANQGFLALQPTHHFTVVTICNWGTYQDDDKASDTPSDTPSDTDSAHQVTHQVTLPKEVEEGKKGRKEESAPPTPSRGDGGKPPVCFPDCLNTEVFRRAWQDYTDHRRENRWKPLKPKSVAAKLAELAEWGEALAIEAIRNSIANGWQGIFQPSNGKQAGGGIRRRPGDETLFRPDADYAERIAATCKGRGGPLEFTDAELAELEKEP